MGVSGWQPDSERGRRRGSRSGLCPTRSLLFLVPGSAWHFVGTQYLSIGGTLGTKNLCLDSVLVGLK